MKISLKIKKKRDNSLETFLEDNKIKISLEKYPGEIPRMRFIVHTDPHVCVKSGEGGHTGHDGYGKTADEAVWDFIKSISGKHITLNSAEDYFICPELEWDGVLHIEGNTKK